MNGKPETSPIAPHLPQTNWRAVRSAKRACAAGLLCLCVGLLCCATVPRHTSDSVPVEHTAPQAMPGLDALDFTDSAFARARQTDIWRYDAQWAQEYPGVATYRSGDNFVSCATLFTDRDVEDAARVLLEESGFAFARQTEENEVLQRYLACTDGAQVVLYLCAQESGAGTTLAWAQVYLAAANTIELEKASVSADEFVHHALQGGAERLT